MQKYNSITRWITLLLILMQYSRVTDSLQCYECENCPTIREDDWDYVKECSSFLESGSTEAAESSTSATASTENDGTPKISSSTSIGVEMSSTTEISSTSSVSTSTTLNRTASTETTNLGSTPSSTTSSTVASSTEKQKTTNSWSLFPNSIEENELNNFKPDLGDRSDELFSWRARKASGFCYVLKLNYEGQEITKRGCGLRGQNEDQTCQTLSNGESNSECEVCEGNLCNGGSRIKTGLIGLLLIMFAFKTYI